MSSYCLQIEIEQENLSPLTLSFFPPLSLCFLSLLPALCSISCCLNHPSAPLPTSPAGPLPAPLHSRHLPGCLARSPCCQSSRRIDDDSLEEQIRQTSEDSRALRELMEGEKGKLRQSLEELQRLHSQVSAPVLSQCRECACVPGLSWDPREFASPTSL